MNQHIVDHVADLLEGRLPAAEAASLREHLQDCEDCRRDVEFATRLRDLVLEADLRHLRAERIVAVADGEDPNAREAEHLERCDECATEIRELRTIPVPSLSPPAPRRAPAPAPRRRGILDLRLWSGVAVAAALVVFALLPSGPDLRGLVDLEPLPVRITRIQPVPGSFVEAWHQGLEAYGDGDLSAAIQGFTEATRRQPDAAEAWLYLGSSHARAGDSGAARVALERARNADPDEVVAEAVAWWLAQVALMRQDRDAATEHLREVVDLDGTYRDQAEALLAQIGR